VIIGKIIRLGNMYAMAYRSISIETTRRASRTARSWSKNGIRNLRTAWRIEEIYVLTILRVKFKEEYESGGLELEPSKWR
jgi:hypothetical protein